MAFCHLQFCSMILRSVSICSVHGLPLRKPAGSSHSILQNTLPYLLFLFVPCGRLSWLYVSYWVHDRIDRYVGNRAYTQMWHQGAALGQCVMSMIALLLFSDDNQHMHVLLIFSSWVGFASYGWTIIFLPCGFFPFFSSPNLSGRRLHVCHTSTHGVALVQI